MNELETVVAEVVAPESVVAPVETEKMIPQSLMNKVVGSEKEKAYQKGVEDAKKELLSSQQASSQVVAQPSPDELANQVMQKMAENKAAMEEKAFRDNLFQEMDKSVAKKAEEDEEFREFLKENPLEFDAERAKNDREYYSRGLMKGNIALYAQAIAPENSADVFKEVYGDPAKRMIFMNALQNGASFAKEYIEKISKSISNNRMAKEAPKASKPLDRINASSVGASDKTDINYWKQKKFFR